jgi:uncharacterized protein YegL
MITVYSTPDGIAGQASHLKLFIHLLADISGSMQGSKIQRVNWAIKQVLPEIQRLEDEERVKIFMSVITFGNTARWQSGDEPVPVSRFRWDDLDATGESTSTALAIELLCSALQPEKLGRRSVPPVCILLSDGYCTDPEERYNQAITQLNALPWGAKAVRLSIGIGERDKYNKGQLDQFISPYLRTGELPVETLPADTPRKLLEYIRFGVTTISERLLRPQPAPIAAPVAIDMDDLTHSAAQDDEMLPDPSEVFYDKG